MKNFIIGLSALIGVVLGVVILCGLTLLVFYGFGWTIGWGVELIVPMSKFFGIEFPQLIGLMSVFSSMIVGGIAPFIVGGSKSITKKLEDKIEETVKDKFKQYRGY